MTTASGTREVPEPRADVWRALAVLEPYCAVCDVSYVLGGAGAPGVGTTFVCAPGQLDGTPPGAGAPRGEILEWDEPRLVVSRLDLTPERWTTRIELAETPAGGTRVSITLTHEPVGGSRVVRSLQRSALRKLVARTVEEELAKVPAHVARATGTS
ncbi:SRPBCC family protein [Blastococcus sp. VKM Ac-2987]|uniref:SRPBCC family protein n=1 Tax=Blastococcus sp. VKM Ac-2987 TaxID=3004141 RepID=UPI0022AB7DE3|nr:SRPBCC family protein [Blastococcus sp. VKM Ac-2987]MCZ2858764.1 SRPBCC family protein [Blastococcus sp. VKM Ac-2987]